MDSVDVQPGVGRHGRAAAAAGSSGRRGAMNPLAAVTHRRSRTRRSSRTSQGEVDLSNVDEIRALRRRGGVARRRVPDPRPHATTTYLDSTGVRLLFELAERLQGRRQQLRLVVDDDALVRRVIVLTQLDQRVPLDPTRRRTRVDARSSRASERASRRSAAGEREPDDLAVRLAATSPSRRPGSTRSPARVPTRAPDRRTSSDRARRRWRRETSTRMSSPDADPKPDAARRMHDRVGRELTHEEHRGVDDLRSRRVTAQRRTGEAAGRARRSRAPPGRRFRRYRWTAWSLSVFPA